MCKLDLNQWADRSNDLVLLLAGLHIYAVLVHGKVRRMLRFVQRAVHVSRDLYQAASFQMIRNLVMNLVEVGCVHHETECIPVGTYCQQVF